MSRSLKKVFALVVSFLLIFSIILVQTGCGSDKSDSTEASKGSQAATQAQAETTTAPVEPVTLTIVGPWVSDAPLGIQDDPVAKEIERLTGVRMDLTSAQAVGDVNAKLAAMIASGEMPDITLFSTNQLMQSAVTAKLLLPLNSLIEKYGTNLKQNVPVMLDYAKTHQSLDSTGNSDGETYIIGGFPVGPFGWDPKFAAAAPWVRWDLYKKAGYPKVDSIDDYIPLMKALLAIESKTADGKKMYGIGAPFGDGPWAGDYPVWGMIPGLYGLTVNTYANVNDMSGNFLDFVGDPNSKFFSGVKFWNKLYREGLVDPDAFTMKFDNYFDKIKKGTYVFSLAGHHMIDYNRQSQAAGESDKYFVQLPEPKDTSAVWVSLVQPVGTPTNGYGIYKNTKYPEQAFKFIDFLASAEGTRLIYNGVKGQIWDIVDNKPAIKDEMLTAYNSDKDFTKKTGVGKYMNMGIIASSEIDKEFGIQYSYFNSPDIAKKNLFPGEVEACKYFNIELPMDLVMKNPQIKNTIMNVPENALIPPMPADILEKSNNTDKYVFDKFMPMILAKTDEAFEKEMTKFIEGVNNAGNLDVVNWLRSEREKVKAAN